MTTAIPPIISKLVGTWLEGNNIVKCDFGLGESAWNQVACTQSNDANEDFKVKILGKNILYYEEPSVFPYFRLKNRQGETDARGTFEHNNTYKIIEWHSSGLPKWIKKGIIQKSWIFMDRAYISFFSPI